MLMVTACIPVMPLQMVFAQQTAGALATDRGRQLAGMIRLGWLWTFILWAIAALLVLFFQNQIAERWQLNGLEVLWVTLAVVLDESCGCRCSPACCKRPSGFFLGRLGDHRQRFGADRGGDGDCAGVSRRRDGDDCGRTFVGLGAWAGIAIWRTRDLWLAKPEKFDGRGLFKQVAPLMLGFGACQFLFTTDTMYAKAFFSGDEMASYVAAGTLSRALLWVVLPLATVMFPKIVHANAQSEKSNLLGIVLLGTAILAVCGAAGLCVVGPFVVKLVYTPAYVAMTTKLLPWYAGRDDSARSGERAGERSDGARKIQNRPADGAADNRLWVHAAVHAAQISAHGSGVANARRVQSDVACDLRVVQFWKSKSKSNVRSRRLNQLWTLDFGLETVTVVLARAVFYKPSLQADSTAGTIYRTANKSVARARRTKTSSATSGTAKT